MTEQCRYMAAAYPILDAEDTCSDHRHDEPTFSLARAMASVWQQPDPTDEQIGWMLDDAAAVVDDFDPTPDAWEVTEAVVTTTVGLAFTCTVNGVPYVIQDSDWEPAHPVALATWQSWTEAADG